VLAILSQTNSRRDVTVVLFFEFSVCHTERAFWLPLSDKGEESESLHLTPFLEQIIR